MLWSRGRTCAYLCRTSLCAFVHGGWDLEPSRTVLRPESSDESVKQMTPAKGLWLPNGISSVHPIVYAGDKKLWRTIVYSFFAPSASSHVQAPHISRPV